MSRIESHRISSPAALAVVATALWIGAAGAASLGPLDSGDQMPPAPETGAAATPSGAAPASGSLFDDTPVFSSAPISQRVIGGTVGDEMDLSPLLGKPLARND